MKMKSILIYFVSVFGIINHSFFAQNSSLNEEIMLSAVFSTETFSNSGLKWGMSMNESEGYIKQIRLRGNTEIAAKASHLGSENNYTIFYENDKLASIAVINYITGEGNVRFNNANEVHFTLFGVLNELLNPQNRVLNQTIRNLKYDNFRIEDNWLYNYGKSKVALKTIHDKNSDLIISAIYYTGDVNSTVHVFSQKTLKLQSYVSENLLNDLFKKKIEVTRSSRVIGNNKPSNEAKSNNPKLSEYQKKNQSLKFTSSKKLYILKRPEAIAKAVTIVKPGKLIFSINNKLYGKFKTYRKVKANGVIGYLSINSF